jgi:hypothetical protein
MVLLMRLLPALLLLVLLSGCWRPTPIGYWTADAYYPSRSHFRILYDGPSDSRSLAAGWTAMSFARANGRPTTALGNAWSHTRRYAYDPGDTGRPRYVIEERQDLSLQHSDASRIEVWTEPLGAREAGFDLGEMVVALATVSARDRPLDLTIAEHARITVDAEEGHQVFFELRDQRPVAAGITLMPVRSCLVAVRPSRRWIPAGSTESPTDGMAMLVFFMTHAGHLPAAWRWPVAVRRHGHR